MTNILSLHFGHNSHAVILQNGNIKSYVQRERISGKKNQAGISRELIEKCITDANINFNDIEQVAITNTQYREFFFEDLDYFSFEYSTNGVNGDIDNFFENNKDKYIKSTETLSALTTRVNPRLTKANLEEYPQLVSYIDMKNKRIEMSSIPYMHTTRSDFYMITKSFMEKKQDCFEKSKEWLIRNYFCPLNIYLCGKKLPGFLIDHHFSHTYSSASKSKFQRALVFSSDGSGDTRLGNLASIKTEFGIFPFAQTTFRGGQFYEMCAAIIGLDCGKFMGLASYGKSNAEFIDLISLKLGANYNKIGEKNFFELYQEFFSIDCKNKEILSPEIVNFAANVQYLFELQYQKTISSIKRIALLNLDDEIDGIILSGGSALNCPSNSSLAEKIGYERIFIEPSCNDEGLAFGAALALEKIINNKLSIKKIESKIIQYASPFLGPYPIPLKYEFIDSFSDQLNFQETCVKTWSDDVAKLLVDNLVGMIVKGKSEIGPRALGNRSIIAIPNQYQVSNKVNAIKNRELWRPLAPACLEKYFSYFFNGPKNPYMLMTCKTKNMYFPGVIHVDGSSRVQCVDSGSENFFLILNSIDKLVQKPMLLLNTSCNRKGEPMINDENIALDYLIKSSTDFLLTEKYLITKKISHNL